MPRRLLSDFHCMLLSNTMANMLRNKRVIPRKCVKVTTDNRSLRILLQINKRIRLIAIQKVIFYTAFLDIKLVF